ncbi:MULTISPECIES: tyrosine-type recombinase/integrase [unclassified Stenotrophomonas]|uniref:tyrosine-type recombinase/integrase n=1 Tax=unclassified Stenotrophomonas TaxID=196198 RepID=UPI003465C75D
MRALLAAGSNPTTVARLKRAAKVEQSDTTFGQIAAELLEKRVREGLSPGSVKREKRLVDKDLASIAGLPITAITAPVLLKELRKLENRGVVETAHRARSHVGLVFRYVIATARAAHNPAPDLVGALEQPQKRHFASVTEPSQIGPLLRALYAYQGTSVVMAALKLASLVFVRPGELRQARWAELNLDAAEWRFTATKTGTPHIVPLSKQSVNILRDLHPLPGRYEYVFPGIHREGLSTELISGHSLRVGYVTAAVEAGVGLAIIQRQTGHASLDMLARYVRGADPFACDALSRERHGTSSDSPAA